VVFSVRTYSIFDRDKNALLTRVLKEWFIIHNLAVPFSNTPIMSEILQLHISLQNSDPVIYRTVQVKPETSFFELHHIIQIAMGWQNYHLFEFNLDGYRVGAIEETEKGNGYGSDQVLDANTIMLKDIVSCKQDSFLYTYNFGNSWTNNITLKKSVHKEKKIYYPVCIDGQLNCPPEDCGGIPGFYYILSIIQDKKHAEYKETLQWVGKKYDPSLFDKDKINKQLKQLRKYISRWDSLG